MNKAILKRLDEIEKKLSNGTESIIRFIELRNDKYLIAQSTLESEIGIEFEDLSYLDNLKKGIEGTVSFIEDL